MAEIFKLGMVYDIKECMGEKSLSLDNGGNPNVHSKVEDIMRTGAYLTTIDKSHRLKLNRDNV